MVAKRVLLNKNMFVLISDEKIKVMVLFKVMWYLILAVDWANPRSCKLGDKSDDHLNVL